MNRRWDKLGANLIIRSGMLDSFEHLESRRENMLRILGYHRIDAVDADECALDPSLLSATPEMFARQMQFLADHYRVLSVDDLVHAIRTRQPLPPRSVMVTIDDGYRCIMDHAWPVLQDLQIPAVLFVPTDYLSDDGAAFWWDRLYEGFARTQNPHFYFFAGRKMPLGTRQERLAAFNFAKMHIQRLDHSSGMRLVDEILKHLTVRPEAGAAIMNWKEVRRLSDQGLVIAAHTASHPILSRVSIQEAKREIVRSQEALQQELGSTWPIFAYPVGQPRDLTPELLNVLAETGFQVAMTTIEGHNVLGRTNPLRLNRVGVAPHLSLDEFRLILTGAYDAYGSLFRMVSRVRKSETPRLQLSTPSSAAGGESRLPTA